MKSVHWEDSEAITVLIKFAHNSPRAGIDIFIPLMILWISIPSARVREMDFLFSPHKYLSSPSHDFGNCFLPELHIRNITGKRVNGFSRNFTDESDMVKGKTYVGLTHAIVNHIFRTHAATGNLVPGKSTGTPWKNTPLQDRALLRMVWQDRSISARALTAQMKNLYGMKAGWKAISNRLLSAVTVLIDPQRRPCWVSAVSAWSGKRCGNTWQ